MRKNCLLIKKNKKKIAICLIFVLIFIVIPNVFAAINSKSSEIVNDSVAQKAASIGNTILEKTLGVVGDLASGTITRLLATLITALAGIGFLLLYSVWTYLGGSIFNLPFPDKIVFNQMSFFDPNFINPTDPKNLTSIANQTNLMVYIKDVAQSIYFTFFIIAGLIMVIAAMIIGIKLALTSIAIEKAQYKEILNKWIYGIVILFSLHFIILGVFTINEQICEIASDLAGDCTFNFNFSNLNIVTKAVSGIKGFFSNVFNVLSGKGINSNAGDLVMPFKGYSGIIIYLLFSVVIGGDLISSIALLALIGQTINLIFQYLKRFVLIVFLAIISPLVVAVDVIKRAI